jgi:hypothetical protein
VEEHRERPLDRTTARDDRVKNCPVLGSDLILAGDGRKPCHGRVLQRLTFMLDQYVDELIHKIGPNLGEVKRIVSHGNGSRLRVISTSLVAHVNYIH